MQARADEESEEDALNRLLVQRPKSVATQIRAANLHRRNGNDNLARTHLQRAIELARYQETPDAPAKEIAQAKAVLRDLERRTEGNRESLLTKRGFPPEAWSPRLRQSLRNASDEPRMFHSEPTEFTFAGLPTIPFHDTARFDWVPHIEAATPAIREELLREIERGTDDFRPYLQGHSVAPEMNAELLGKKDWSVLPVCERGWVATALVERFPKTWAAVQKAPLPGIYGWGPTVVFSLLKAGARIPAHTGMFNTRLICHLPLIVPPGCRFRVGNEVREWEVGKLMMFDDTIEHEAWNDSDEDRVVLIFDIWRPELSSREREELEALFSA
jgi:aspartyl/asparaginyl beta-hydroxylase (cupin superfamily)